MIGQRYAKVSRFLIDMNIRMSTPSQLVASSQEPAATHIEAFTTPETAFEAYPEGGLKAYSVLLGSWCALLPPSGLLNSIGSLQAYLHSNQLKGYTESQIGWIFSVFAFLFFFGGLQAGTVGRSFLAAI